MLPPVSVKIVQDHLPEFWFPTLPFQSFHERNRYQASTGIKDVTVKYSWECVHTNKTNCFQGSLTYLKTKNVSTATDILFITMWNHLCLMVNSKVSQLPGSKVYVYIIIYLLRQQTSNLRIKSLKLTFQTWFWLQNPFWICVLELLLYANIYIYDL